MGATQMVAYNTQTGQFLKKVDSEWTVTNDFSSASGYPQREIQLAVTRAQKTYPGNWMIMRRQDAMKLPVRQDMVSLDPISFQAPLPEIRREAKVTVVYEAERSEGSEEIISLMSRLEAATSANRMQELLAQVSEYDKMVSEIYHYFEANKLNACQGYKAYKNLRKVLLERRAVKNELSVVQKFRSGKMPKAQEISMMTSRLWSVEIDELMGQ